MRRWDEHEIVSIYPKVSWIYTPCGTFHHLYPCIYVHPWSLLNDILGGRDRASLEMHLEAVIHRVCRCVERPWCSEFCDGLGGRDRVNSVIHSEAVTKTVWRCTCRLWLRQIEGVLGGDWLGGRHDGSWDSIFGLTCNGRNVESWVQHPPRDEKLAVSGRLSILVWCCTWCMLYSVLTHDSGLKK